jgi:hypothetical protein
MHANTEYALLGLVECSVAAPTGDANHVDGCQAEDNVSATQCPPIVTKCSLGASRHAIFSAGPRTG